MEQVQKQKQEQEPTPLNKDFQIQSLVGQNANLSLDLSEKDSLVRMQYEQIQELQEEIKQLREEQISEMDKEADKHLKGGEKVEEKRTRDTNIKK